MKHSNGSIKELIKKANDSNCSNINQNIDISLIININIKEVLI
jgi:hypothetical protein